jgi:FlaA1/EpsC-like NDP-sugar epimerase
MPMSLLERCARRATRLPRAAKAWIAFTTDLLAMPLALFVTLALKRGTPADATHVTLALYFAAAVLPAGVLAAFRTYHSVFRFISTGVVFRSSLAVLVSSVLLAAFNAIVLGGAVATNAIVLFTTFALLYIVGSRALVREWLYLRRGDKERILIYGAGTAGAQLAASLRDSGQHQTVAFIDRDPALTGRVVAGVRVHLPEHLPQLIQRERITSAFLAIPSCSPRQRQLILKSLEPYPVHVRTVPDISDIIAGRAGITDLREVEPSDLLEREPVAPDQSLLEACIRGKVVMVSGAGGSIGSELCRQIVRLGPQRILLLEMSEPALYQIDRELRTIAGSLAPQPDIVPLLGNAHHRERAREIMQQYRVQSVYHAAAYKHVPIVEQNIIEGIHNNVFSTWYLAEAALDSRVETFVLISSDKAVNPTNVMGATKRFAELTLQALQQRSTVTRFCMVRFGNVLESSGSVVPLFREQIKRGGPVTVTHRDVIRYFMTIPEASQLVLQASAMGQGGDVFVLDMGKPLRIEDLARRMIHLMGLTVRDESAPEGDIEIVYTGLRPAEKLYEELLIGSNVTGTEHPMIMRAMEPHLPWSELKDILADMLRALDEFDCPRSRELLMRTVTEYRPASGIQDLVWQQSQQSEAGHANVTHIRTARTRPGLTPASINRG